jgi:hypothetical protein
MRLAAMTIAVVVARSPQNYSPNWRLAPNTTVILMSAVLNGSALPEESRLAMSGIFEVMPGSTVAFVQTLAYVYWRKRWRSYGV